MQIGTCTVLLAGDRNMAVPKANVTPAEVAMLRIAHGADAVLNIKATGDEVRPSRKEKARLMGVYGKVRVEAAFPGVAPSLPATFEDIEGLDPIEIEEGDELEAKQSDPNASVITTGSESADGEIVPHISLGGHGEPDSGGE